MRCTGCKTGANRGYEPVLFLCFPLVPGRTRGHAWQLTLFSRAVIVSGPDFADTLKLAGKDTDMEWCVGFSGGIGL
jgi:hypothetical protein